MQFFATAAILAVAGIASAAETVSIADFSARKNDGALQATSFKIQPAAAECSSTAAADIVYPRMTQCGNSLYHFQIKQGEGNAFSVTLTKETGMNEVINGTIDVPVYCHAGGNGPNDFVCTGVEATSIVLY
ncbi:putative major allergen-like protein [Neofusicoccum parvum]|uniref:Major allergen-like protein n=2 Tax=Neofusicoccum parvum TaxID=310453 RepID=A0ACB5SD41_9PEZI|nr:putative major allergen alt a1 protein [Neofusicoccum parvum UCRNP2]GME35561.1 putative major allergen-like protein [Neofusicoccum parvum]GME53131.1 putative major allergen-like protein [Neofusicoccum parvum]